MANIRISRKDKAEYNRLRRNTLSKLRRVEKSYGIDLSSEVNLTSLDSFTKRAEFNKWKEEQESFTNIGNTKFQFVKNKHGTVASKSEIYKGKRDDKSYRQRQSEFQEKNYQIPVFHQGKQISTVGQRMQMVLRPSIANVHEGSEFNFDEIKDRAYLLDKLDSLEKKADPEYFDKMLLTMQLNYLSKIEEDFGSVGNNLFDKIYAMTPEEFNELYLSNIEAMSFEVYYDNQVNDDSLIDLALHLETIVNDFNSDTNRDLRHPNFS